jgi:hypothetical protein
VPPFCESTAIVLAMSPRYYAPAHRKVAPVRGCA